MKGVVFRGLEALVIEKCGMAAWDDLLEKMRQKGVCTFQLKVTLMKKY
ncbi:hypothetical protein P20652_3817 [Pseudoalteromonas sp. BSi20652]|nr:hypothetical protein [Pseudoalteromonas sp. BSi20652]GAA61926.1 hypothetical protein P20652_3817 [Pseudoalteromonas sp. BSi20652]